MEPGFPDAMKFFPIRIFGSASIGLWLRQSFCLTDPIYNYPHSAGEETEA